MSPELFVARSPAQFAALSAWFSQALRWAAGDLDQFPLDVVVSDAVDDRTVRIQLQERQPDAAQPLTASVWLEAPAVGYTQRLAADLRASGAVTLSVELPLQIVHTRILACTSQQDCAVREMFLDPLRRERLGLWETPGLPLTPWSQLRAMSRTGLQLQSGQAVAIESESREHLTDNPWVLAILLLLAVALWLSQRRMYRAVV